ncbi:four-helix bundle copper-binding protein [Oceanobacillus piezotolerans]|uniref:Four-helix bundle copper-binding protein n=1 Tax=Oceanobacillus piezotolerans TaxID=2448030 RepID=A0A498DB90_9BACI|nr:four-helix bundle copper-binding protein [Oceanobacillus piezotolerans]RLL48271.1 four-helix bundle copper-binding protein [Oceanobacillus piezotolerans]
MAHEKYNELLQALHECMAACNHCYDACLQEEDMQMMANCIRLDRECADICGYLEQAIARNSAFVGQLAKVCAEICEACGQECQKHTHEHCQRCAQACLNCSEACKRVA